MRRRLVGRDAGIGQDLAGRRITIVGDILHSRARPAPQSCRQRPLLSRHMTSVSPAFGLIMA
ncbi:hypothetical protein ABZ341_42265, partial [Streptomyces sp. NPDC006173]